MSDGEPKAEAMFTKVIVAVGADSYADRLVPVSSRVAAIAGVPIELATVVVDRGDGFPDVRRRDLENLARHHDLVDASAVVLSSWSVPRALAEHVAGEPSSLLSIASSVHGRLDDLIIGSVSGGVLNAVTTPVLLLGSSVPDEVDPGRGPVVVCTDGSAEAESIIPLAQSWIALTGQEVWVVSQLDPDLSLDSSLEQRGVHRFAEAIGPQAEWEVLHGSDAGGGVARFAAERGAGLIIMATHGRSALARAALGSTAMRTMEQATCPVLVQRPTSVPVAAQT